jgi:hypothetical protein
VLQPEQVVEYPWWQQLSTDLGYQVRGWDAEHGGQYHRQLAVAPGWKVGGWPQWPTTDPRPLYCTGCGGQLRQLLQLDSHEWGDPTRWRPVVEPASGEQPAGDAEPTGVIAGDTGLYRVFTCPSCPAHPDQPAAVHPDQPAAVHPDQPAAVHPDQPAAVRIDLQ